MTTKDREKNEIFWLLSKNTLDTKIYKAVMNKKSYTNTLFKKDYVGKQKTIEDYKETNGRRMVSSKIDSHKS